MTYESKVTAQNQTSVPAEIRRKLGVVRVLKRGYQRARSDTAGAIEALLSGADFFLQREDQIMAALALFRASRADFSDCLLLEHARDEDQLPLLAFAKALAKLLALARSSSALVDRNAMRH